MNKFKYPEQLRIALNKRLKSLRTDNKDQGELEVFKRQASIELLLARLEGSEHNWILKGGFLMNLRFADKSRRTMDIDLALAKDIAEMPVDQTERTADIINWLREDLSKDLGDFFRFEVGSPDNIHGNDSDGSPHGALRVGINAYIGNHLFNQFHMDIGVSDMPYAVDYVEGKGWFDFADIPASKFKSTILEQQFSEKLHAYSMPRQRIKNTRFKDLVDMVIMVDEGGMDPEVVAKALRSTFGLRNTHDIPVNVPLPPIEWEAGYGKLAKQCGVEKDMQGAYEAVKGFMDNINSCHREIINVSTPVSDDDLSP